MRFLTIVLAWLLAASPALAIPNQKTTTGVGHPPAAAASSYTGPGDIVASATAWYGLRAYNAAYATGSNKAINVRRASDNATQDILILSTGALDIASANTFAGTDATCTGTISTTTLTCASASSTPHAGSTLTGTGITQPSYIVSCGTFTGGAGTCTLNASQTVSVGETITMQYGLYVTEAYDQTGNSNHVTQATAGKQPQLLPNCGNDNLPCLNFIGANDSVLGVTSGVSFGAQPFSAVAVGERTGTFTSFGDVGGSNTANVQWGWSNSANTVQMASTVTVTASAADNVIHSFQFVFNNGASNIGVDGTNTGSLSPGGQSATVLMVVGDGRVDISLHPMTGYLYQFGFYPAVALSTIQQTNLCHNDNLYFAMSLSC